MKRRLMSRKQTKSRSGARSTVRIFSGNPASGQSNTHFLGALNTSSNIQVSGEMRKKVVSATNKRAEILVDSRTQPGSPEIQ